MNMWRSNHKSLRFPLTVETCHFGLINELCFPELSTRYTDFIDVGGTGVDKSLSKFGTLESLRDTGVEAAVLVSYEWNIQQLRLLHTVLQPFCQIRHMVAFCREVWKIAASSFSLSLQVIDVTV